MPAAFYALWGLWYAALSLLLQSHLIQFSLIFTPFQLCWWSFSFCAKHKKQFPMVESLQNFVPFAWDVFHQLHMILFQISPVQRGLSWPFCLKEDYLCYSPYEPHCYWHQNIFALVMYFYLLVYCFSIRI